MKLKLANLTLKLQQKYAADLDTDTVPEGIGRVLPPKEEPKDHREHIIDALGETIAPYIDWVGDHIVYQEGTNWIMEIDFMNIPEDPNAKKLNHSEFYYYILDLVQELKRTFPSAHINMESSSLKGPHRMMIKTIKVTEPFGAPY